MIPQINDPKINPCSQCVFMPFGNWIMEYEFVENGFCGRAINDGNSALPGEASQHFAQHGTDYGRMSDNLFPLVMPIFVRSAHPIRFQYYRIARMYLSKDMVGQFGFKLFVVLLDPLNIHAIGHH
jgi:hypothetical protein